MLCIRTQLGIAKKFDGFGRIWDFANQFSVFQYGFMPHLVVRVKRAEKKMGGVTGSRVLDLLLAFIGKNQELTGYTRFDWRRGMILDCLCFYAPHISVPSEQRTGHAPESLI